jgi:branched-chain amino acid transport system ATP-binding protein
MLKIRDLHVNYGGIKALRGISLDVPEGKIITLIGANGAGKSTTLRSISGLVRVASGKIIYQNTDVTNMATRSIVKKRVILAPEGRRVFPDMTVEENLKMGAYLRKDQSGIRADFDYVYSLFPRLQERKLQLAGTLSGGEQQMLAVARSLMARPRLLMMDEPSLGLAPLIVKDIFETIEKINKEDGVTILLIEQNAHVALSISDYAYVMETGTIGLEGVPSILLSNKKVQALYLGM